MKLGHKLLASNKWGEGGGQYEGGLPILTLNSPCIQICNTMIYIFNIRITI